MELDGELTGYLVISLEQAVAAPYCGMLLANSGARVIKVERPEGDFARGYDNGAGKNSTIFAWLNNGKQSICLNFDKKSDADLLNKMLDKADILLSNLAPGALKKRGFTGTEIRKRNPKLIHCSISGYGSVGVGANKKAYDFLVQAETGLCSVSGINGSPSRVGISITDLSTGLTAFSAILRALLQRNKTKLGLDIEISMFDVMADWMNMPLLAHRYFNNLPKNSGLTHSFIAPYGAFTTKDGKTIVLSVQNNREWRVFCEKVIEAPKLIDDPKFKENTHRFKNKAALEKIIINVFSKLTKHKILKKLDEAKIAYGNLNEVSDLSKHELLRNKEVTFDRKRIQIADLPIKNKKVKNNSVPALNQDDSLIRNEFLIVKN